MKLALVVGQKSGDNQIKPRLIGIKDNLDIDCFDDVPRFIDSALKRNCIYDRILVLSTLLADARFLEDLHTYWSNTSKETSIILLCRKGKDEVIANDFTVKFTTPVVSAMLVESTTVAILASAVLLSPIEIAEKYGVKNYMTLEVDDGVSYVPSVYAQAEEKQREVVEDNSNVVQGGDQKKGKRSLLSALFGGKKKVSKEDKKKSTSEMVQPSSGMKEEVDAGSTQGKGSQVSQGSGADNGKITPDRMRSSSGMKEEVDAGSTQGKECQDQQATGFLDTSVSAVASIDEVIPTQGGYDLTGDKKDTHGGGMKRDEAGVHTVTKGFGMGSDQGIAGVQTSHVSGVVGEVTDDNIGLVVEDDDFSNDTFYSEDAVAYNNTSEIVDADLSSLDLSGAEEAYQQNKESPKVVTKTVVREVVRSAGSSCNVLRNVYSGRSKKILIVTGDRATGVTSTAIQLARGFSEKVQVLYFDCDGERHGLLSYLDYDAFRSFEKQQMEGVKLCKSSRAFSSCVISYESNLDILTSDYSCDVTDSELEVAQSVVAEQSINYGVVVVDCPISKLSLVTDLILQGNAVVCVEGTKRGFMNMLCELESSDLSMRYKRNIVSKGSMFATKCNKNVDLDKLLKGIRGVFDPSDVDWLQMRLLPFNGKLNDNLLNTILEG